MDPFLYHSKGSVRNDFLLTRGAVGDVSIAPG